MKNAVSLTGVYTYSKENGVRTSSFFMERNKNSINIIFVFWLFCNNKVH